MATEYYAFVTLATGGKHKITQETYNHICEADKDDLIVLDDKTAFKSSAVMEIQDIREWVNDKAGVDYHQPYEALPPMGFAGVIDKATQLSGIAAMIRGMEKARAKLLAKGQTVKNLDKLLSLAQARYIKIQKQQ